MTSYVGPLNTLTYGGRAFRLLNSIPLAGATAARPLGARSGVRPGTPATTVEVSGSTWTCHPHAGVLDVATSGIAGPYGYAIDADVTGTVTAAHATLTRVDSLYVQVNDNVEDTSGLESLVLGVADGTPGGAVGAIPVRAMLLATLSRASAAAGGAVTVTWAAPKIAAAGGVIPVENTTVRDAITWGAGTNPAWVYRGDTDTIERNVGAGWDHVAGGTPTTETASIPAAGPFTNTTFGVVTTATWAWTPTRSGLADVVAVLDLSVTSAGFSLMRVRADITGASGQERVFFESQGRAQVIVPCSPVRVRAGVAVSVVLNVAVFSASGSASINSGLPASFWQASVR